MLLLGSAASTSLAQPSAAGDHVSGRLLVQKRLGANPNAVSQALAASGASAEKTIDALNILVLRVPEPAASSVAAALARSGQFTFVEPDFLARSMVDPNDPNYPSQWHLSKIQTPSAWGLTTGAPSVAIAMVDSGVDSAHPDIIQKVVAGWNFLTGTSNTSDTQGHGTATAGTAAADTNNGTGVAGVGWDSSIMPLVVVDSAGYASYSNIASAITYAAGHGARVISISIAGSSPSSTLQSAVNSAWNMGAVVVAAAGNYGNSTPMYPAACTNVVSVGATDANDLLAGFSNYGSWVDVVAPGTSVLTTNSGGGYGYWSGTSFSTPIVSGILALMVSENPGLSASSLVSVLEQNTDDLGTPGFDDTFGYGRVNAYKALAAAKNALPSDGTPPSVSITSPPNGTTVSGTIPVQGTATDKVGVTSIQFVVDGEPAGSAAASPFSIGWDTTPVADGSHTLTVNARDAAGNVGSATVGVTVKNTTSAPPDTQPPTVTITKPANDSRVVGNVNIAVNATDNIGVAQVTIRVDGTVQCTGTSAPYVCFWNAKKVSSGTTHTITAEASDGAGNTATTSITVMTR